MVSPVRIMKKRSTLERQMFTYFGLIAAASLLIMGEFLWAIQTSMTKAQALTHASTLSEFPGHEAIIMELGSLRNKAVIMCVVQAVVTLTVLIMFLGRYPEFFWEDKLGRVWLAGYRIKRSKKYSFTAFPSQEYI